jgi:hypothetical protein
MANSLSIAGSLPVPTHAEGFATAARRQALSEWQSPGQDATEQFVMIRRSLVTRGHFAAVLTALC